MSMIKKALADRIPALRNDVKTLSKEHGEKVLSNVTVAQAYGGMRGVKGLVCDTSLVEPERGLIIRGIPISELTDRLPEEIFYLLCVGELPGAEALKDLQKEFKEHGKVSEEVFDVLKAMPKDSHPMDMLITGILAMENESVFRQRYDEGMRKEEYWEAALDDSIHLLAKLPAVAAAVYRISAKKGDLIKSDPKLDWAADYAHMLGNDEPEFADMMRLYLVLHSDHEGGNVSAFTTRVVGSALSDPYYSLAAGLCGLAGPLHGLANQECLIFIQEMMQKYGGAPTEKQVEEYAWEVLNSGKVVPGYGHAVLRVTDPRFTAFHAFGEKHFPDDPVFASVARCFKVVPKVLTEHGKAKSVWPNVDAGSGALLFHYGLTEMNYYTVLFSLSRAMGVLAQLIMSRGMGEAITRPKSVTTDWVKQQVGIK
jgi:citrate synthase